MEELPFEAAQCKHVQPFESIRRWSAFFSSSLLTICSCPCIAAQKRGVHPEKSRALMSTRYSRSVSTITPDPRELAQ